jgi:hypothetical protein
VFLVTGKTNVENALIAVEERSATLHAEVTLSLSIVFSLFQ